MHNALEGVRLAYDQVALEYDNAYQDEQSRLEDRTITEAIEVMYASSGGPILDLGCGTGWVIDHLQPPPAEYVGIDISPRMLEQARRKHPFHTFLEYPMEGIGERIEWRRAFGLVVSTFGAFSYAHGPTVLRGIAFVLRPGGASFLMAYGPNHPGSRVLRLYGTPVPYLRYDEQSIAALYNGHGPTTIRRVGPFMVSEARASEMTEKASA